MPVLSAVSMSAPSSIERGPNIAQSCGAEFSAKKPLFITPCAAPTGTASSSAPIPLAPLPPLHTRIRAMRELACLI